LQVEPAEQSGQVFGRAGVTVLHGKSSETPFGNKQRPRQTIDLFLQASRVPPLSFHQRGSLQQLATRVHRGALLVLILNQDGVRNAANYRNCGIN
jgi:hypothetical protein